MAFVNSPINMITTLCMSVFLLTVVFGVSAGVICRNNATAPAKATYFTCTELRNVYIISVEKFMFLDPSMDPDCTNNQAGESYCVAGNVVATTTDGTCKPQSKVPYLEYSRCQCCNRETFKCGNAK